MARLRRQLGAQHLQRLDRRRRRKQRCRLRHQSLRNRSVQATLASGFVADRIEHRERGGSEAQREPHQRGGFLVGEGEALAQEVGALLLLAWLGFETGEQCELHNASPWLRRLRTWSRRLDQKISGPAA